MKKSENVTCKTPTLLSDFKIEQCTAAINVDKTFPLWLFMRLLFTLCQLLMHPAPLKKGQDELCLLNGGSKECSNCKSAQMLEFSACFMKLCILKYKAKNA